MANKIVMVVQGYVPPSQNALRGKHWSVLYLAKQVAGRYLYAALESHLQSMQEGRLTGTTIDSKTCRIALSKLDSYTAMRGSISKAQLSLKKRTRRKKKGLKS